MKLLQITFYSHLLQQPLNNPSPSLKKKNQQSQ